MILDEDNNLSCVKFISQKRLIATDDVIMLSFQSLFTLIIRFSQKEGAILPVKR